MYKNITNVSYDYDKNKIILKYYNSNTLEYIDYSRRFYTKHGLYTSNVFYDVDVSDKKYIFTNDKVDMITIKSPRVLKSFSKFDLEDRKRDFKDRCLYQYDCRPETQFLLYNEDIELSCDYNTMYLDIETDDSLDVVNTPEEILLITIEYKNSYKVWDIVNYGWTDGKNKEADILSERKMLSDFFRWLCTVSFPDVIFGWNVTKFDREYLVNRASKLSVNYEYERFKLIQFIDGIDIIQKMYGYSIMSKTGGFSLDKICKYFLKTGKLEINSLVGELYRSNRKKAIKYNLKDVKLLKDLDNKLSMIQFLIKIQKVSKALIRDSFYNSIVIDHMLLSRYKDYVFPSKAYVDEAEKYEGGYVLNPPFGIYENVTNYDFASMYPSIIMTFNVSPDTKDNVNSDFKIDNVGFKNNKNGIFKDTIYDLYCKRLELKNDLKKYDKNSYQYIDRDITQLAYKNILNSFYGVCAFKQFRLYDMDLAKSITSMGRKLIKVLKDKIDSNNYGTVLYSDTDSVFVHRKKSIEEIHEYINNKCIPEYLKVYGVNDDSTISVDINDNYDKILFVGKKKKYIGKLENANDLYIKGFDIIKYDIPNLIRNDLKEIVNKLMKEETVDIYEYGKRLKKYKYNELIILKRMNKEAEEYKNKPQHLKGLEWSIKNLDILEETKKNKILPLLYVNLLEDNIDKIDMVVIDDNIKELPSVLDVKYVKYFIKFYIKSLMDVYYIFGNDKIKNLFNYIYKILVTKDYKWYTNWCKKNNKELTIDTFFSNYDLYKKFISRVDTVVNRK
jgi:DNA polymerase elongation subunit (family B)